MSKAGENKIVHLNVGGKFFSTTLNTLRTPIADLPETSNTLSPETSKQSASQQQLLREYFSQKVPDQHAQYLDIASMLPPQPMQPSAEGSKKKNRKPSAHLFQILFSGRFELLRDEKDRIFIDRNPKYFPFILDFLRAGGKDGAFTLPKEEVDKQGLLVEAKYFNITKLVRLLSSSGENSESSQRTMEDVDEEVEEEDENLEANVTKIATIVQPVQQLQKQQLRQRPVPIASAQLSRHSSPPQARPSSATPQQQIPAPQTSPPQHMSTTSPPIAPFEEEDDDRIRFYEEQGGNLLSPIFFENTTLLNQQRQQQLNSLCGKSTQIWKLLYKGSVDGFEAKRFHELCDGSGPTLTVIAKHKNREILFGGYTSVSWHSKNSYSPDPSSWLFMLGKEDRQVSKFPVTHSSFSIFGHAAMGVIFGAGPDLCVGNGTTLREGTIRMGVSYGFISQNPQQSAFPIFDIEVFGLR